MDDRAKKIRTASWVAIIGNTFLALLKIVAGFIAGSLSVVADGIDSSGDVLISILTLYIANLITKPPNAKFPYGYYKAEPNATIALSFLILFAGAQLGILSVKRLIDGSTSEMPGQIAIIAIIVSVVGKLFLAWYQRMIGKRTKSSMLIANSKNMQGDVVISLSVLIGLILTHLFNMPILDNLVALAVSIWLIRVAVKIFLETNLELMDGNVEQAIYKEVFDIVESEPEVRNPHRMRIRKVGHRLMINIDIELDGEMSLHHAHMLSHKIEKRIRDELQHEVFDVIIHSEPYGDEIEEQNLGITRDVLDKC
jgi:cation diffusion facilitator family transporter